MGGAGRPSELSSRGGDGEQARLAVSERSTRI